jgi:HD-like signal output (HDOD) protein
MMVAHCSGHIYKHLSSKPSIKQEELYTFGLLNSIGLLLMVYQYPDEMHQVFEQNVLESLLDAERQYFDNNHYQVGARLLDHWGLPSIFYEVLSALGASENIDNDAACIANILRLTQAIVNYLYHDRPAPTLENWESIGLESSIIDEIRASFIEANAEVTHVMQLLV